MDQEPIPTSDIARPSKIYPNLDFWFENQPSGNPYIGRLLTFGSFQKSKEVAKIIGLLSSKVKVMY
jgi:hypothetical protein